MKLLYICTHNACRSILAEVITRQLACGRIDVASAGSAPSGRVHPLTIKHLQLHGYHTDELKSQSWDEFEELSPDAVITVCDQAAGESCPLWLGSAIKVHWGLTDPTHLPNGDEQQITATFSSVIKTIESRINRLLTENIEAMDKAALQSLLIKLAEQ